MFRNLVDTMADATEDQQEQPHKAVGSSIRPHRGVSASQIPRLYERPQARPRTSEQREPNIEQDASFSRSSDLHLRARAATSRLAYASERPPSSSSTSDTDDKDGTTDMSISKDIIEGNEGWDMVERTVPIPDVSVPIYYLPLHD